MPVTLRPTLDSDLGWVTALERHPDNREAIGQWSDEEHLAAVRGEGGREHWIVERDGARAGYLIAYDCRGRDAGIYVKRILVADRGRGTGKAALAAFLEAALARPGVGNVWLIVRNENIRAQALYEKLGFRRFEPEGAEGARYDAVAEAPMERCFRMRIEAGDWAPAQRCREQRPG